MKTTKAREKLFPLLAGLVTLALVAAACGGGNGDDSSTTQGDNPPTTQGETPPTTQNDNQPAAQDRSLVMGRANWSTGYFQAALVRKLLQRLDYEVTNPAEIELGPSFAYLGMAQGDFDFWANSWYPLHNNWLLNELPDESPIGDHVSPIGALITSGALQGYFITKSFAEKYDIKTLDDLNNNPEALAEYDRHDATPGNGIAEIYGCSESWTCEEVIQSQIAFSGWENIAQVRVGYEAMFAEATRLINDDLPTVVYTWTPSAYFIQLQPGERTLWLGVEDVLDDSNPLGLEGGAGLDQRPGTVALTEGSCANINEEGICTVGWLAANIGITARNDVIENHPMVAALFRVIELSVLDVSNQIVAQEGGTSPDELADQWIADNADTVEGWLATARAAA